MHEQYHHTDTPDIMTAINNIEVGQYTREARGAERQRIVEALDSFGLTGETQSQDSIERGIHDAQWLVESGEAAEALKHHPFTDENDLQPYLQGEHPTTWVDFPTDEPVVLQWNKLDGAASFDSWLGRGREGMGEVDGTKASRDKIFDFAARDSQLPSIEVTVILTPDKPICIAMNSHRAAAAILRSENIGCHFLTVIDARGEQ